MCRTLHRKGVLIVLFASMAGAVAGAEQPRNAYPSKPIRLVVPFPPGGSDVVARMIGQKLGDKLGQMFVVDNRPGAASTLGANIVAKAAGDGYTILFATASFAISASVYRNLPYDPIRDFVPVALVCSAPMVLVVHPSLPASTVKDFIALAKSKPGKLNYGSSGSGGMVHLAMEMFASMADTRLTHIPYKGSGPMQVDLLAGSTQVTIDVLGAILPLIQAGRVRALGLTSAHRSALLPDLPTVAESGVPGYQVGQWYGVLGPRGMPERAADVLNAEIASVLGTNEMRERLAALAFEPLIASQKEFAEFLRSEMAKWSRAVKESGVVLD